MSRSKLVSGVVALATCALVAGGLGGASAGAASSSKFDPGINSAEALKNPLCDATKKQIKFPTLNAPPCVKEWKDGDDNGGKTAQGVDDDSIKVVVLYTDVKEDAASPKSLYLNRSNNTYAGQKLPILDADPVYASTFETWGRKVEYEFVLASGADETAQRADAVKVAAMKPFAVMDAAVQGGNQKMGGLVFETDLQAKGVPLVLATAGVPPLSPKVASRPYAANMADFAGKSLVGKKAEYAGDAALKTQERKFGVLYQGGVDGFDIEHFKKEFAKHGGKITSEAAFEFAPGAAQADIVSMAQQQMPQFMAKMKSEGVTSVIVLLDGRNGLIPALPAATSQDFFPEWINGQFPQDLNLLARNYDQKQWANAFGLVWFVPWRPQTATIIPFDWYWGTDKGSSWPGAGALEQALYQRIHLAGPQLTAAKMKPGALKGLEPVGGYYSDSVLTAAVGPLSKEGIPIRDSALGWWSPDTVGPGNSNPALGVEAAGVYMYLDGGKRYVAGKFPKNKTGFFDKSLSTTIYQYTQVPASEPLVTNYPCTSCPSSGSSSPAPASSS